VIQSFSSSAYDPHDSVTLYWSSTGVRQKLGWALTQEQSFDAVYQSVSDFYGHTACLYLSIADGRVVSLCDRDGSWGWVTP
jgi:hypothetical protein